MLEIPWPAEHCQLLKKGCSPFSEFRHVEVMYVSLSVTQYQRLNRLTDYINSIGAIFPKSCESVSILSHTDTQ
jgi:hypothetical protein